MIRICPVCGKKFDILYPRIWVYRRGERFICSWSCLRQFDNGKDETMKLTLEMKKQAVQIALDGDNQLVYLKNVGIKNPTTSWNNILDGLKKADPDTYQKLMDIKAAKKTAEKKTAKKPAPARIETPEAAKEQLMEQIRESKICKPLQYEDFIVRSIERNFGRYSRTDTGAGVYIDFESKTCDMLSMTVDDWKGFMVELKRAALVLGVDLDADEEGDE